MLDYKTPNLAKACQILFVLIGGTTVLYFGRSLLIPLTFALILAMLLRPLCRRLERWGIHRAIASVLSILVLVGFFVLILYLLSWQLDQVMRGGDELRERSIELFSRLQEYISRQFGLPKNRQQEMLKNGTGGMISSISSLTGHLLGVFVDIILVLVYIFLFLFFRGHLLNSLIKAVSVEQKENVRELVSQAGRVAQQYLMGLALMIVCLWIMYSIGFSIIGVRYAIFFALLCGTLELIPFFGNITGTLITVSMGILQGGDFGLVAGILITYGSVQFIQSYILQPWVVGGEVNLNPLFTILCIVIGEALWGVAGMVLAIPLFGIIKITCDHFESLKPYGYLLGGPEKRVRKRSWFKRMVTTLKKRER
ncbi:MAG TPA: AI-2E family transporter [Mucilaginibacter sp.]